MATSGAITDWLRELTATDYATLTAEAARGPAGADGLLMLPYFAGERTPLFDPDARGVLAGLTLHHTRGHLYRAALEATAFGVRHNLEAIACPAEEPEPLRRGRRRHTGGLWTQIVSDVIGRPQLIPRHTIGAAYGDAFLAAVAVGNAAIDDIARVEPRGPRGRAGSGAASGLHQAVRALPGAVSGHGSDRAQSGQEASAQEAAAQRGD